MKTHKNDNKKMTLKKFKPLLARLKKEAAEEQSRKINLAGKCPRIKSVHPFSARMGMDIVWDSLKKFEKEKRMAAMHNNQALRPARSPEKKGNDGK